MLKRIHVDDLCPGMFLEELCASWMEHPFWRTSFLLKDERDAERIRACGVHEMWINTAKGIDVDPTRIAAISREQAEAAVELALAAVPAIGDSGARSEFTAELGRAELLCRHARGKMVALFDAVRLDRPLDTAAAADLVDAIAQSVGRNPGALISLARLKNRDEYTVMHAVAVCALMIAMARQLGLNEAHTHEAGLAGLLHDVGKLMVPDAVLNKPDKLTDGEFAMIRRHAELGHRMLADQGTLGEIPLDVVLHHHEKVDGSGYPHGLSGEQIGLVAKMGAVCDVYDAITSHRPYKRGLNPAEAVRKMAEWSQGHFDIAVFHGLVRTVGIYPIGSLVRMESGRLAVVVEHQEQALTTPKVKVFFSIKSQAIITPQIVDLARPSAGDRIVAREDPAAWGLPRLEELWGAEAAPRIAA